MKIASVTELKANLSKYLKMVQRGSEVQVQDRGVPIARLVGLRAASSGDDRERLERLERAGILRRGTSDLRWLTEEPPVEGSGAGLSGKRSPRIARTAFEVLGCVRHRPRGPR